MDTIEIGWRLGIILAPSGTGKTTLVLKSGDMLERHLRLEDGDAVVRWPSKKDGVEWFNYMNETEKENIGAEHADRLAAAATGMQAVFLIALSHPDGFFKKLKEVAPDLSVIVVCPNPTKLFENTRERTRVLEQVDPEKAKTKWKYKSVDDAVKAVAYMSQAAATYGCVVVRSINEAIRMLEHAENGAYAPDFTLSEQAEVASEHTVKVTWPGGELKVPVKQEPTKPVLVADGPRSVRTRDNKLLGEGKEISMADLERAAGISSED